MQKIFIDTLHIIVRIIDLVTQLLPACTNYLFFLLKRSNFLLSPPSNQHTALTLLMNLFPDQRYATRSKSHFLF